jgi:hypothetical protein
MNNPNYDTIEEQELSKLFACLTIMDKIRGQAKKMSMPDADQVFEFEKLAVLTLKRKFGGSEKIRKRRMRTEFGTPPVVMAKLWELLMNRRHGKALGASHEKRRQLASGA